MKRESTMNWKALQQLHQLYESGTISSDLLRHSYVERLRDMGYMNLENKLLNKTDLCDGFYERKHLAQFKRIKEMLVRYDFVNTNLKGNDLEILLNIEQKKDDILHKEFTQKEIATRYFDDSKYLKTGSKLHEIILKILDVETLRRDEHDQQFLWVLHCQSKTPTAVVLCENDDQLRKPRLEDIELWFAGGNNTAKLAPETPKYLPIQSEWKTNVDKSLFRENAMQLLEHLTENNLWIEEESMKDYTSYLD